MRSQMDADQRKRATLQRETKALKTFKVEVSSYNEEEDRAAGSTLEKYLISVSPFNDIWTVSKTISAGSYGVAFMVKDKTSGTQAVLKVAQTESKDVTKNTTEWETFILERTFKMDPSANIVRLLDKGLLQDDKNNRLDFMAVELCEMSVYDFLAFAKSPEDRKYRCSQVAMGSLKAVFDLHKQGILHRDIKPENMGMLKNDGRYICVLYDLGTARMYTDEEGRIRPPRTTVPFRGSLEWASGHATKGRDQTRLDDLISWFYSIIELFDPDPNVRDPFPWDYCYDINTRAVRYLKSIYAPARLLLHHCPSQFYAINTYLMSADRFKVPAYAFIANQVGNAMFEYRQIVDDQLYGEMENQPESANTIGSSLDELGSLASY